MYPFSTPNPVIPYVLQVIYTVSKHNGNVSYTVIIPGLSHSRSLSGTDSRFPVKLGMVIIVVYGLEWGRGENYLMHIIGRIKFMLDLVLGCVWTDTVIIL